jgi:hypothetical protein
MSSRLDKTLADYLVIAVSPVLIMAMVGSLVFFLVEIFYQGHYEDRLRFVLGAFVMAAVLIGRISIEFGTERAAMYAMPLALVTGLAINKFVVAQGGTLGSLGLLVNLGLLGFIWWAAHKLVWDCTLIDEAQDSSGEGLVQIAGLAPSHATSAKGEEDGPEDALDENEVTSPDQRPLTWRERLLARQERSHAPGVWIVYFSLAALPLFGIGQALAPADNVDHRRYIFRLLVIYVASGLGLLLTTSFLGLRRYLRQRRLQMPVAMAGLWVTLGGVMILVLLAVALILPRPNPEYSLADLAPHYTSPPLESSAHATSGGGADRNRPNTPAVTKKADNRQPAENGQQSGQNGPPQTADSQSSSTKQQGKAGGGGRSESGKQAAGKPAPGEKPGEGSGTQGQKSNPQDSQSGDDQQMKGKSRGEEAKGKSRGEETKGDSRAEEANGKSRAEEANGKSRGNGENQSREAGKKENASQSKTSGDDRSGDSPNAPLNKPAIQFPSMGEWVAILLKGLSFALLALIVGVWLFRSWRQLLSELGRILAELRSLWQRLWGGKRPATAGEASQSITGRPAAQPFAAFADPFATGAASRYGNAELIRYSFDALEAWARERGCPRGPEQTPHEFAQQIGETAPSLVRDVRVLADLYCRIAYAGGAGSAETTGPLRRFWRALGEAERQKRREAEEKCSKDATVS